MKCGGIARFSTERNLALSSISVKAQALQESNTGLQPYPLYHSATLQSKRNKSCCTTTPYDGLDKNMFYEARIATHGFWTPDLQIPASQKFRFETKSFLLPGTIFTMNVLGASMQSVFVYWIYSVKIKFGTSLENPAEHCSDNICSVFGQNESV